MNDNPKPRRRWYQFSLRRLMLAVGCFAASSAFVAYTLSLWNAGVAPGDSHTAVVSLVSMFLGAPTMFGAGVGILFGAKLGLLTAIVISGASFLVFVYNLVTC